MNAFGRWVIPVHFDEAGDFEANNLASAKQNGLAGLNEFGLALGDARQVSLTAGFEF